MPGSGGSEGTAEAMRSVADDAATAPPPLADLVRDDTRRLQAPRTRRVDGASAAVAAVGAVLGVLPAADGLYRLQAWGIAGAVAVVCLVAAIVLLERRPRALVLAAPFALALLGVLDYA